jgi:glycosyltransferase involved in cell wall biosynthesis
MRLLIFVDWFLPGYKAGGQISSCTNIVYALKEEMDIYIITRDRDLDDEYAYPGIVPDTWTGFDNSVKINYVSPAKAGYGSIKKLIREVAPDTIYFNSMFSFGYTLLPLLAAKTAGYKGKVVLAPRGMLQAGALQFKSLKKKTMLNLLYITGMLKNVLFHATEETELTDINANIKGKPAVKMVYDFPAVKQDPLTHIGKAPGELKCIFISRIVGKKNLLYLLQAMASAKQQISLTIVGPVEDKGYWEQCQQQIAALPTNCTVQYMGPVPNPQLPAIYKQHHLFVLPTHGENFGHVIYDAFLNGRPVLISTQTPWRQLAEKKVGKDVELSDKAGFLTSLEYFAAMDDKEMNDWCSNAWSFAHHEIEKVKGLKDQYKSLFS